jgi:hypothetical protein
MSPPTIRTSKSRAVKTVKFLTLITVALFSAVFLIVPTGITVPWNLYFVLFAPIIIIDVSALTAFGYCRSKRYEISIAYAVLCTAILGAVAYLTLFGLRLRWPDGAFEERNERSFWSGERFTIGTGLP